MRHQGLHEVSVELRITAVEYNLSLEVWMLKALSSVKIKSSVTDGVHHVKSKGGKKLFSYL